MRKALILVMVIENIKYTIVTVCYNERHKIEKTIESVIQQRYSNLEYLFIDGASNDGTLEIIQHYAQKDKRIRVISEPDAGIYNAMNKAISIAKGDYINFMNAGDSFAGVRILDVIAKMLKKRYPDILCGKLKCINPDMLCKVADDFERSKKSTDFLRIEAAKKLSFKRILLGKWAGHQAVFAKTNTLRQYYFNEKYKIAADFDWFVRNVKNGSNIEYANIIVCNFVKDGISNRCENLAILDKELDNIIRSHYGIFMLCIRWLIKKQKH